MTEEFKKHIDEYKAIDWDALLLKEKFPTNHLGELESDFRFIKKVWDYIIDHPFLEKIGGMPIHDFRTSVEHSLEEWLQIKNEILSQEGYSNNKNLIDKVRSYYENKVLSDLAPVWQALRLQENFSESQEPQEAVKKFEQARQKLEAELKQISHIKSLAADQSIEKEVWRHEKIFSKAAKEHRDLSYWCAGLLLVLTVGVLIGSWKCGWLMFEFGQEGVVSFSDFAARGNIMFKLFFLGCFFTVASILAREYMAHRHQMVSNKIKANALNAYHALSLAMQSSKNTAEKEILLTELARCIFNPQTEGFVKSGNERSSNLQIVEMAKLGVKSNKD